MAQPYDGSVQLADLFVLLLQIDGVVVGAPKTW